MAKQNYTPNPIDTSSVVLPEELAPLAEELAKNVHEVWAKTRIEQGWTYGDTRDDLRKQHPCIVPYDELSEGEKEFDRNTSQETLRLIIKLGFKITKG
ncbi:MAG: RyR domain-containing protein [Muribaculaceae bacterium]|mgnify:CR=1 FL=1